jgi:hypothetical protein
MFIDTIPNRKSPPAVLLRESYREGGRVKKRTLANLSKLPRALIDGIAALLDGGKVSGKRAAEPGFEIVRSLPHGHVAAVKAVIGKLGLERTLQGRSGVDKRVRNLIEAMIIQRIVAPGSKLAFHRALAPMTATSSLALSVGLIDVAEREVYAALDWLIEQQTRIEAALAQRRCESPREHPSAAERKCHCLIKGMADRKVSLELQRNEVGGTHRRGRTAPGAAPV